MSGHSKLVLGLPLAIVLCARTTPAHADAAVIPAGQERLVTRMLGGSDPIAGCTLASASIQPTRIDAAYECGPGHTPVQLVLEHPDGAIAPLTRTRSFALRAAGRSEVPAGLVLALHDQIAARESAFVWIVPTQGDGPDPRVERSARPATRREPPARSALAVMVVAMAIVLATRRRATMFPFAMGMALAVALFVAGRMGAEAIFASTHGARGITPAAAVAAAAMIAIAVLTWTWSRRITRSRAGAWIVAGVVLVLATSGYLTTLFSDVTPRPRAFGPLFAWRPRGHFDEADPRRAPVRYRINARGFRGREWPERPEAGTLRGVVIGGARVTGLGLDVPETMSEQLATLLRGSSVATRVEVLNLGIPGDTLRDHVDVYATVRERFAPDFVVLCVSMPGDLSDWSTQNALREWAQFGSFSLARSWFGADFASWWFSERSRPRDVDATATAILDRELARLGRDRRSHAGPPLLLFAFDSNPALLRARTRDWPGVYVVPNVRNGPGFVSPATGEPTAAANEAYAQTVRDALDMSVPAIRAAGHSPPPGLP